MKSNIKLSIILVTIFCIVILTNQSIIFALDTYQGTFYIDHYNRLEGAIANKYKIDMVLYCDKQGNLTGNYFYTKYKKKIKLKGEINQEKKVVLFELDDKGNKVAKFKGKVKERNYTGRWFSLKNNKKYDFNLRVGGSFGGTKDRLYGAFTSKSNEEVENFLKKLKENILNKNKEKVAEVVSYPLLVKTNDKKQEIKNKDEFIEKFENIFYDDYLENIRNWIPLNLGSTYRGMWFGSIMINDVAPDINSEFKLKVRYINNSVDN